MSLKLIKTTGGSNGAPTECNKCFSSHFQNSGLAWHCTGCGTYYPTKLGFDRIKEIVNLLDNKNRDIGKK